MMGGDFGSRAEALTIFKVLAIGLTVGMAIAVGAYLLAIYLIGV